jgi:hypothetical protein
MPVNARRLIRKMRGGAQAHLLEADDGAFYVVKFQNNPQHRRILVNEWIAAVLLEYLQIPTPGAALVNVTAQFVEENPDLAFSLGSHKLPVKPGWHFGSRYPGDPKVTAVYDFVPDALLQQIHNLRDFLGVLVFDKWAANADGRQCVFHRARLREWDSQAHPQRTGFVAQMIDQGFVFNGPHWDFPDSPIQGLYSRRAVYDQVRSLGDFQPWLALVENFPEPVIDQARKQIPPQWIEDDEDELDRVLDRLMRRRKRVSDLIRDSRQARTNPFPNWQ